MREEVGVRRRVRARRAPDRALVDLDDLVEAVDPLDALVVARLRPHAVQPVRERLVEDLVHERRLARARDAGDGDEPPHGEVDVDALQVVHRRAADGEPAALVVLAPRRDEDPPLAAQELPGDRAERRRDVVRGAVRDDLAPVLAGARPEVDHPVRRAHHLLVVLDDEDGVAHVAEPLERRDEASVVALVEPDRRLVEDVEDADELRADLRRQPQALRLAARERLRRAVELEVADADVLEERQPLADLLEDAPPDQLLRLRRARARRRSAAPSSPTSA